MTLNRVGWKAQGDATADSRGMGRRRPGTPHPPPEVAGDSGTAHPAAAPGWTIAKRGVGGRPVTSPSCFSSSANREPLRRRRVGLPISRPGSRAALEGWSERREAPPPCASLSAPGAGCRDGGMPLQPIGAAASKTASLGRPAGTAWPGAAHGDPAGAGNPLPYLNGSGRAHRPPSWTDRKPTGYGRR